MFDFQEAPVGVQYSELAEKSCELVSHLRIVSRPETRELLSRHRLPGETFRTHQIDASNPRAVVGRLKTAYLIEPAEIETGNVVDWTVTARAERIIDLADEHGVYITDAEADAILRVGSPTWMLPSPQVWWTESDIDVDLHPRELGTLADAGLVRRAVETGDGFSAVWRTSDRLHDIATVVWGVIADD